MERKCAHCKIILDDKNAAYKHGKYRGECKKCRARMAQDYRFNKERALKAKLLKEIKETLEKEIISSHSCVTGIIKMICKKFQEYFAKFKRRISWSK